MKRYHKSVIILTILIAVFTFIQDGFSQGNIYKEEVVYVNDSLTTQNTLFAKANEWFAVKFNSANDVIQMIDKEAGKIVGKGYMTVPLRAYGVISFTFIFECKDGRYKYSISDVVHRYTDTQKVWGGDILLDNSPAIPLLLFKSQWKKAQIGSESAINALIKSLKDYMEKANENEKW